MPRSGPNGTYSLPPIYLAVPGTTIIVDQHNVPLEDIETTFNTPTPILYGGTGASLTDPGADRLQFWDDSAGVINWLALAAGLGIVGTTLYPQNSPNVLINPAMQVSQENGASAGTTTAYYPVDMLNMNFVTSAGALSVQQVASVTTFGSANRIRLSVVTADASLGAAEFLTLNTLIEGLNASAFQYGGASAKQSILRFGIKAPAGTYSIRLTNSALDRSYVKTFTPAAANTDEYFTLVIPGDVTGTWLTTNGVGIRLAFVFAAGSSFLGTDAVWQTGNISGTIANTNGLGSNTNVFELFDVGLYLDYNGTGVAPQWTPPQYPQVLMQCQRYVAAGTLPTVAGAGIGSPNVTKNVVPLPVPMRSTITASIPSAPTVVGSSAATISAAGSSSLVLEQTETGAAGALVSSTGGTYLALSRLT